MNPTSQERPCIAEEQLLVDSIDDKPVLLDFQAGRLSSDAGMLLLGPVDEQQGLLQALASVLPDQRDPNRTRHAMIDLMRQRVFQIAAGYEDQLDSDTLRSDPIFKLLLGRLPETGADLASQPTMSRFENGVTRAALYRLAEVFVEHFIQSYDQAPEVIVLDFDDTADLVHGQQEKAQFNAYVGDHCFMPLHVYEGLSGRLILTILKPRLLKGMEMLSIVRRLVSRLRQAWPKTEIIFRGDSHFTYPEVMAVRLAEVFVEHFIQSYDQAPEVIVLDFDDTADLVHGQQEKAQFNAYVGDHCFMPLHVYEGLSGRLILTILKPRLLKGMEMLSIVRRLVSRLRQAWPKTEIIFRGDSHFTYPEVMAYLESQPRLHYVTGLGTNSVLKRRASEIEAEAQRHFARGDRAKVLRFHSIFYQAGTWPHPRRVVIKVEVTDKGVNTRFIVTDLLRAGAQWLYQRLYCARGQMENYIKDHKTGLQSDRTSCHRFLANAFRLVLHSAAYVLLWGLRAEVLGRSSWSRVRFETLQLRLLKLGAVVKEEADQIRVSLPFSCPVAEVLRRSFALLVALPGR